MSKNIRIAHLAPAYFAPDSYVGGGERYVDYVTQALSGMEGIEQCIFLFGPEARHFEKNGIPVRVLKNQSPQPGMTNAYSAALWQDLSNFDLVHLHQCLTRTGAYCTAVSRSLGIPTIGTDLGGDEEPSMLTGRGIGLLNGIISISRYAHSLLCNYYTGPHEILVGPIDTDRFSIGPWTARDRQAVLCVSPIEPHKGIDCIIAALPENMSLSVVGRVYHQPYYELLRQMADSKDVRFVLDASSDALLELYHTSGVFVQASTTCDIYNNNHAKSELMGLPTLEAMASGLPAVVSDTGSLPELVPDPRFGRIFSNEAELTSILRSVSIGAWPGADAGAQARAHVVERHGMNVIGRGLANFYKTIAADRKSPE